MWCKKSFSSSSDIPKPPKLTSFLFFSLFPDPYLRNHREPRVGSRLVGKRESHVSLLGGIRAGSCVADFRFPSHSSLSFRTSPTRDATETPVLDSQSPLPDTSDKNLELVDGLRCVSSLRFRVDRVRSLTVSLSPPAPCQIAFLLRPATTFSSIITQ